MKEKLEVENFSGIPADNIRQDFYAAMTLTNIAAGLYEEAEEEQRGKGNKWKYQVNVNHEAGVLKDRLNGKIMAALLIEAFIAKASFPPVTGSNTNRSIWRETAFVTLVLKTNPGLRIPEDYEHIAKCLECEKRRRGIRQGNSTYFQIVEK